MESPSSVELSNIRIFRHTFLGELWGLEDWNLVHTWAVGRCIMYTRIRLVLLICPFISSIFFLSNFQHRNFSSLFSQKLWGLEDWNLVVPSWYTHRQWADVSCILESGCCCLFISVFLHFLLSLQFSTLKFFVTLFSGTVRPRRMKLGTHMDSGQMYHVYRNQAAALIHPFLSSFFFLSNFQH